MGIEIERKFLVTEFNPHHDWEHYKIIQGYIAIRENAVVRVRLAKNKAVLSVKALKTKLSRHEFEYSIPLSEGEQLIKEICLRPIIEKTRYLVPYEGHIWEVDVFEKENQGLILAEIELQSEEETFEKPDWISDEVTGNPRYYNFYLVEHPFHSWKK